MFSKSPRNTEKFFWTEHAKFKMKQYGLSAQKILGVINRPARKEEGIVKNTLAVMQPVSAKVVNGKKIWKQEIWAMFQKINSKKETNKLIKLKVNKLKIISAWRYPGISPKNNPIPEEIMKEIGGMD